MDITQFIVSRREGTLSLGGDYNLYRQQVSRRIRTLRKKLGRSTPRKAQYSAKPITAEDIKGNHEFVHLLLLISERAWAHAMQMKSVHAESTTTEAISGSSRKHIVTRLDKASRFANELTTLLADAASGASKVDVLEAKAYAFTLSGTEEFEKQSEGIKKDNAPAQRWESCLQHFSSARVIYNSLLQSTKKDEYKETLAGTVDPSIRYAAYQYRLPRSLAVPAIAKRFFPKEDSELLQAVEELNPEALSDEAKIAERRGSTVEKIPNTITWRSRKANIVDASIGQALAAVSVAEEKLESHLSSNQELSSQEKASAYDEVLLASSDAADATKHAIDELEQEGVDEGDSRMQDLRITSLAVNYSMIGWRIGRNRVLIGKDDGMELEGAKIKKKKGSKAGEEVEKEESNGRILARLRERVVLYDATLQSIDSVKELRGAVRDASFVEELEAKRAYFQALKCLNIAYSHALLSAPRNALALLARAEPLSSKAATTISSLSPPLNAALRLDIDPNAATSLHQRLQALVSRYRALVELSKFQENEVVAAKKGMTASVPVIERLDVYPNTGVDLKNLVTWPPKLEPVPVKPLFFDVAWNYVEYPGRSNQVAEEKNAAMQSEKKEEHTQKKGWFGWR